MKLRRTGLTGVAAVALAVVTFTEAYGQQAAQPAPSAASQGNNLPEVTVEQKKPAVAPKAAVTKKKAPAPQPVPVEAQQPAPAAAPDFAVAAPPGNIAISPLPGSEVPIEKIPRGVTSLSG